MSPWHLLERYVYLTSALVPQGSLVFRALSAPYSALSADRIASLTKRLLEYFGVYTQFWGPHSTRGAGVQFYKKLGLTSDQVCEIGQWKNVEAFTHHYLRVGAHDSAAQYLAPYVHRASQGQRAEPEGSTTPPTEDRGGGEPEGEAQRHFEPTPLPGKDKK